MRRFLLVFLIASPLMALTPTPTPTRTPTPTPTITPTHTPGPSPTPTITPTPYPAPSRYRLSDQVSPCGYPCRVFSASLLGDTYYGSSPTTFGRIAGNTTATRKFWAQTGTGSVSAAPAWVALGSPDLPVYADNATAITGGLAVGDFYRTGADPDPVMVVHTP